MISLRSLGRTPSRRSACPRARCRFRGWRKPQAQARHQLLRVDARARAEERARLRALHRSMRDQPSGPR